MNIQNAIKKAEKLSGNKMRKLKPGTLITVRNKEAVQGFCTVIKHTDNYVLFADKEGKTYRAPESLIVVINREYRFVFQPKEAHPAYGRRFGVGAGKLSQYITEDHILSLLRKASECTEDKGRWKLRSIGLIDYYLK
jgi:hypothetical protein